MTTLKESSKAYQPKKTLNISELEVVNLDCPIAERIAIDNNGKEFKYKVALINDNEYRVPESVLNSIKNILSVKPNLKMVRVIKKGQGMATEYTVIPLD